jgi:ketosteroid isomerase-like protein
MKLSQVAPAIFLFVIVLSLTSSVHAQNDKVEIQHLREAYNTALKNYDIEQSLSFMTEGILSTISTGALIQGKANLREYIQSKSDTKMYWVRTPKEIDVNTETGLAWETGTWKGYTPETGQRSVTGGKYSAQWIKVKGTWKVNSELFVKLE